METLKPVGQNTWKDIDDAEAALRQRVEEIAAGLTRISRHGGGSDLNIALQGARQLVASLRGLGTQGGATRDPRKSLRLSEMRSWSDSWPGVDALIAKQLAARPTPLFLRAEDLPDTLSGQTEVADQTAWAMHSLLNPLDQDSATEVSGAYGDISLPLSRFVANIHAACRVLLAMGRADGARFLDVGCGNGEKLLAAGLCFDRVTGLELDPGYAALAQDLLQRAPTDNADIVEADALLFDDYAEFDVIYFFRPIRFPDALARLEDRIVAQSRPETLLIAPYRSFARRSEALGLTWLGGSLFLSEASSERTACLCEQAELMGNTVLRQQVDWPEIWRPILDASRRRGFLP